MSETQVKGTYLGNKVINCRDLSFYWDGKCYLKDFTYNFQRYERVGIVGRNAAGKTTFLNLITGGWKPELGGRMEGVVDLGESLRIGYYHQSGMEFKPGQTVLETVNDTHLLGRFLFTHDMLNNPVERLSGGEKRRLYLLTILMKEPNFLILDEPTNDLDIMTLEILEEYLQDFPGCVIVVSHDRYFMDKVVDHLLVFKGQGKIKDFPGNYTQYRTFDGLNEIDVKSKKIEVRRKREIDALDVPKDIVTETKRKLSFKEKREMEQLERDIKALEAEQKEIETALCGGTTSIDQITQLSKRLPLLKEELDEKSMRWLELSMI